MSLLACCLRLCAFGLVIVLLSFSNASAHCFVGARFFPATLATDDPCVADEMSLPTVSWSKTGDMPSGIEWDVSGEISKRITEDFGVSIGETWTQIRVPGSPTMAGFADLETTFQYQLLKDNSHELVMLLGLIVDWGSHETVRGRIGYAADIVLWHCVFLQRPGRIAVRLSGGRGGVASAGGVRDGSRLGAGRGDIGRDAEDDARRQHVVEAELNASATPRRIGI
jgi:hypothetical protein